MLGHSRYNVDATKILECWCVVRRGQKTPDGRERTAATAAAAALEDSRNVHNQEPEHLPAAYISEAHPRNYNEGLLKQVPTFAFPCDFQSDSVLSYNFVFTTDNSKFIYGFCRYDPRSDSIMVILTYFPWHETFLKLLTLLSELYRNDRRELQQFLDNIMNAPMPHLGGRSSIPYSNNTNNFVFERPVQYVLPSIPESNNLNIFYNFIDVNAMIGIFAAMLTERRIIFVSQHLDRLSACTQAAADFLYPMIWQHIFIPILPMKLSAFLSAPMPFLVGVPTMVYEMVSSRDVADAVIVNCDTKTFHNPYDDVSSLPTEIVSRLKKGLNERDLMGDTIPRLFLRVLVQLLGGYRDAIEFHMNERTFNAKKYIESRPSHIRPYITNLLESQTFSQFIEERIDMMNCGLGLTDEFERETASCSERLRRQNKGSAFLRNVKEKTNPAMKTAVKTVKEGSRGVKSAYKDLKSKLRDITPPHVHVINNEHHSTNFFMHLGSNSQHDRMDGHATKLQNHHHSAPSSPVVTKRLYYQGEPIGRPSAPFQYVTPAALMDSKTMASAAKGPLPLAMSSSSTHIQANGYANLRLGATQPLKSVGWWTPTKRSPSPASSQCSSEMNLSQELQEHPLFKSPPVDRSLKPNNSSSLEVKQRAASTLTHNATVPPARPPPPSAQALAGEAPNVMQTAPNRRHKFIITNRQLVEHEHRCRLAQKRATAIAPVAAPTYTSTPTFGRKMSSTLPAGLSPPALPPLPPRRLAGTQVEKLRQSFESSSWHDANDSREGLLPKDALRDSASSHNSRSSGSSSYASTSSASFVSAASSPQWAKQNGVAPVPAPRTKKESLRSLQPQHLALPSMGLQAASSTGCVSQADTMNDLISLDDSNNASFDLEDFDPLNQNARPLPPIATGAKVKSLPSPAIMAKHCNGNTNNTNATKPLYPYINAQEVSRKLMPPTTKPPPPPTDVSSYDDEFELLRKYGLDQFTLTINGDESNGEKAQQQNQMQLAPVVSNQATRDGWMKFD